MGVCFAFVAEVETFYDKFSSDLSLAVFLEAEDYCHTSQLLTVGSYQLSITRISTGNFEGYHVIHFVICI